MVKTKHTNKEESPNLWMSDLIKIAPQDTHHRSLIHYSHRHWEMEWTIKGFHQKLKLLLFQEGNKIKFTMKLTANEKVAIPLLTGSLLSPLYYHWRPASIFFQCNFHNWIFYIHYNCLSRLLIDFHIQNECKAINKWKSSKIIFKFHF